jgi:hypothetical protein
MSDATTTNANILWTVTYGAVFKARHGKSMKLLITIRSRSGKWSSAAITKTSASINSRSPR